MDATIVPAMGGDTPIELDDASSASPAEGGPADNMPDPSRMTCDGGAGQCPLPPSSCDDAGVAVTYQGAYCNAGICSWHATALDCTSVGGTCAPGSGEGIVDGGTDAEGGVWARTNGCLVLVPSPAPPATPCSTSADASDVCPFPQSVCADSKWLVYYDNGRCVAGSCVWETRYTACPMSCTGHDCMLPVTPK
jgi:hypothetical protein